MNKLQFSWPMFSRVPLIGIVRNMTFNEIKKILPIYLSAGLTTIEVTMNTPAAKEIIRHTADKYAGQLNIGAGTVCNKKDLKQALSAGAQFIVTPVLNKKVIRSCLKTGIPVFPGAFSPTEIYQAWKLGASMVKVYPATCLGPVYIKDIKAPLNQIKLLPTGGITKENLSSFMKAGSDGLGIGSQLFNKQYIETENWDALGLHFEEFVEYFKNTIKQDNF
jgi:2-dehydro-3-deoxyphosphogluconate aldolase/(4S)-4-hydroxy-2-oxoglutarate aldolase